MAIKSASTGTERRRAAVASLVGTSIEYYDFYLYGIAAALIFGPQFFPTYSPTVGVLAAFGVFGAGFIARPLGGIIMGHFGDRVGRKSMLVFSLLLVGGGTFLIGLLPNYDTIGIWAPILLVTLRIIQGFGIGGEWGGAVLMSVEHAPKDRQALYGTFPQMGIPIGMVLANTAFLVASTSDAFADWVWRIPFIFAGLLVFFGLYIRLGVAESPAFKQINAENSKAKRPIVDVLKSHRSSVLIAAGLPIAPFVMTYVFATYGLSYMTTELTIDRTLALTVVLVGVVLYGVNMIVAGLFCDRLGVTKVYLAGCAFLMFSVLAYFPLINTKLPVFLVVSSVLLSIGLALTFGPVAVLTSRLFPANLRYSGTSIGYQVGSLVGAAPVPLMAAAIFAATKSWVGITGMMLVALVISALAGVAVHRREAGNRSSGPESAGDASANDSAGASHLTADEDKANA